jgi:YVTN family beta-propeller protein
LLPRWLTSERLSGTVTFLFTDIEGSIALLKNLGRARYSELMADQQRLLREAFAAHGGEEIDTQGDSFFVAFRSASDAVSAAVAIEHALADHEWPEEIELRVRIGIHSGEAAAAGERYVGFSVHRAARIGDAAHGGQVLLSDSTRSLVEDDLPEGVFLRDLGTFRLKDVDRPERISQLAAEGLWLEFPPLRGAERVAPPRILRRRSVLAAALAGVIAAAVAIPVFALGGGSGGSEAIASIDANAVGVIDPATGRLVASIPVGTRPNSLAAGEGSVWVTNLNADTVSRINPSTNTKEQTIQVGNSPQGVAVGGGFVWVANSLDGTVSKIDPNANSGSGGEVDRIRVGNGPTGGRLRCGKGLGCELE